MTDSLPQTYLNKVWWVAFLPEYRQFYDYFLLNDYKLVNISGISEEVLRNCSLKRISQSKVLTSLE